MTPSVNHFEMVKLLFVLCAVHGTACHQVDPLYQPMSSLTCNMEQLSFYAEWVAENPELVIGKRLVRALCVPVRAIQERL